MCNFLWFIRLAAGRLLGRI